MSRRGVVARASPDSFAGLEKAAKRRDAKGIYFERGPHPKAREIAAWLEDQDEGDLAFGQFAAAQLLVAPPREDSCDDSDCDEDHSVPALATGADVAAACDELVRELPPSFRGDFRADAAALVAASRRLCPGVPWITLRIEILQHEACWRWHQDGYCGRTLISYVGRGTLAADDRDVDWKALEASFGAETNAECVSKYHETPTNAVLLMKGDAWPGLRGNGLTHKSPREARAPLPKRVLLKCDLTNFRPMLAHEEDSNLESSDDDEERSRSRSRSR